MYITCVRTHLSTKGVRTHLYKNDLKDMQMSANTTQTVRNRSAKGALVALSLAILMASLGTSIANVGLPALSQAFGASFQQVQWIVLAYLLAITSLIVGVGRLGDLAGRRKLLSVGIAVFTSASVACGLAPTLGFLIAARAVQGLGAAILMALGVAFVRDAVPEAKTGSAMGLMGTMSATGTALGPSLGGLLISAIGWRAIFFVNVPLGLAALYFALRDLPADRAAARGARSRFDLVGTALLSASLASYTLAVTTGESALGRLNVALLIAATAGLGLFLLVESRAAAPLIQLRTFRNPLLSAGLGMSALVSTVMMATLVVGPFYLAHALGLSVAATGLVMTAGPLVAAVTAPVAGRFTDRIGTHRMTIAGLTAMAGGCFALSLLPSSLGVPAYIAPIVIVTGGYAVFQTANNTSVMKRAEADQRGVISGMLNLSRNLGLITGASVMGAVFAFAAHADDISSARPAAVADGLHGTFLVAGVLMLVALAVAIGGRAWACRRDPDCKSRPLLRQSVPQNT